MYCQAVLLGLVVVVAGVHGVHHYPRSHCPCSGEEEHPAAELPHVTVPAVVARVALAIPANPCAAHQHIADQLAAASGNDDCHSCPCEDSHSCGHHHSPCPCSPHHSHYPSYPAPAPRSRYTSHHHSAPSHHHSAPSCPQYSAPSSHHHSSTSAPCDVCRQPQPSSASSPSSSCSYCPTSSSNTLPCQY